MKLLQDKVALITGGSRGIGAALVARFVEHGAHVAFTYRSSAAEAEKVIADNAVSGITIKAYQSDASNFQSAETLVNQVIEDFGKLDILVNNAGIKQDTLLLSMTEEQWDNVIETNLKSVFNLCKQVLKPMMKAKNGAIINMGSIVGVTGNAGQANYAASKAGIIGFTKSLAKEMGTRNIRCNTVAPGFIETDMTDELDDKTREAYLANIPLKRFGKSSEVADVCVFLASDMGAYISGQTISVCGALTT
ncbi:MAG: 3-oxoacyl-[acyl-carrier-protein] reductase [Bacteroidota bacterium]